MREREREKAAREHCGCPALVSLSLSLVRGAHGLAVARLDLCWRGPLAQPTFTPPGRRPPVKAACLGGGRARAPIKKKQPADPTWRSTFSLSLSFLPGIPTRLRPPRSRAAAATPGGGAGGGVAERPATTPSLTPSKLGDKARSSPYRVLLHNDDVNKREYVVSVLMKVVDGLTVDDAVNVMNVRRGGRVCV